MEEVYQEGAVAGIWTADNVASFSRHLLGRRQLIIAANRAPYTRTSKGKRWSRPAGGLAAALDPVLQATGGFWMAASPPGSELGEGEPVPMPPGRGRYRLQGVPLTREQMDRYYLGYANGVLWPLCHMLVERARFRAADWVAYREVNARFAGAIAGRARPGDLVWFHDYHLALAPRMLKREFPECSAALFWHIPWPPHDIWRLCPRHQRQEILAGMLGCDLIGFHTGQYALNFLDCASKELGAVTDPRRGTVAYKGHLSRVQAFPISIDFERMATRARSRVTARKAHLLKLTLGLEGRVVGVGIDRLDYTKGLLQRLEAMEILFERYPDHRGKITFVQVAVPGRTGLEPYRRYKRQVEERVAALNRRYRTRTWRPIKYIGRLMGEETLAALYRIADFAVVNPIYDGMNLVAKEFVACQVERPGVLLLSETAGASQDLKGAIAVDPLDPEGLAEAMRRSLGIPPEQRRRQVAAWQAYLARNNVYKWAADILQSAVRAG